MKTDRYIGFTGTRHGMSTKQLEMLTNIFEEEIVSTIHPSKGITLCHGDCLGADREAHNLAIDLGMDVIIHPPLQSIHRAYCTSALKSYPPKSYLERNRDIVDCSDYLIAAPLTMKEYRSGTWYTINYAKSVDKPIIILER